MQKKHLRPERSTSPWTMPFYLTTIGLRGTVSLPMSRKFKGLIILIMSLRESQGQDPGRFHSSFFNSGDIRGLGDPSINLDYYPQHCGSCTFHTPEYTYLYPSRITHACGGHIYLGSLSCQSSKVTVLSFVPHNCSIHPSFHQILTNSDVLCTVLNPEVAKLTDTVLFMVAQVCWGFQEALLRSSSRIQERALPCAG